MTANRFENSSVICGCMALLLFLAAAHMPYDYYTFVRIIVCGCAGIMAYRGFNAGEKTFWPWLWGLVAIIFNPFAVIHMTKVIWMIVDVVTGILFGFLAYKAFIREKLATQTKEVSNQDKEVMDDRELYLPLGTKVEPMMRNPNSKELQALVKAARSAEAQNNSASNLDTLLPAAPPKIKANIMSLQKRAQLIDKMQKLLPQVTDPQDKQNMERNLQLLQSIQNRRSSQQEQTQPPTLPEELPGGGDQ